MYQIAQGPTVNTSLHQYITSFVRCGNRETLMMCVFQCVRRSRSIGMSVNHFTKRRSSPSVWAFWDLLVYPGVSNFRFCLSLNFFYLPVLSCLQCMFSVHWVLTYNQPQNTKAHIQEKRVITFGLKLLWHRSSCVSLPLLMFLQILHFYHIQFCFCGA